MKVPLLDLKKQYNSIRGEVMKAAEEVFESQQLILGPKVEEFERKIAAYSGCKYAVGVSSGTDALLVSLMAGNIGHGDLVITTPYTFFATVGSISRLGATPVFVDINEDTYNMDPVKLAECLSRLSEEELSRLKAVIPVHLYGQCADMEPILKTADEYGLVVIEDAAQAIGAEYTFGDGATKRAGSMGHYGCFSFYPTKNLGAFGEGGMVTTNSEEACNRIKLLRNHGDASRYEHSFMGGNFRLDALQAAVLMVKLGYLDEWTEGRIKNACIYKELFESAGLSSISLPFVKETRHIYHQFVIKVPEDRDGLKRFLREKGIGCEVYYPVPLHMQECFKYLNYRAGDFPISENAALRSLALPVFPELTEEQLRYVVDTIKDFE